MREITAILILMTGLFAENNATSDDAYFTAKEAYNKGDSETAVKYLLLSEKLGNNDAYFNLCWICKHDRNNSLTIKWCSENDCQL